MPLRKALGREKFSPSAEQQQMIAAKRSGLLILNGTLLLQLRVKSVGDAGLHNHSKFGPKEDCCREKMSASFCVLVPWYLLLAAGCSSEMLCEIRHLVG